MARARRGASRTKGEGSQLALVLAASTPASMSEVQISFRVEPGDPLWGLPVGTVVDFSDIPHGRQLQLRGPMRLHRSEYFEGSGRLVL